MILSSLIQNIWPQRYILFNFFTGWLSYLFFYLYGGLVRNNWVKIRNQRVNVALVSVGYIFVIVLDYLFMLNSDISQGGINPNKLFSGIPLLVLAVGLFNILITADFKTHLSMGVYVLLAKIFKKLAELSYGIYLTHLFIVGLLLDKLGFGFDFIHINVYLYCLLYFIIVLAVSAFLTHIIHKTSSLRWMIGE